MAHGKIPGDVFEEAFVGQQVVDGVTAHAGGGQAGGVLVISSVTRVTTVGTAGDSLTLPSAKNVPLGTEMLVMNAAAANSLNVFPATGESIDALGANAARAVAAGKTCAFIAFAGGVWHSMIGA